MSLGTTQRQQDLLRFIAAYQARYDGISPCFTECVAALGLHSNSGVTRLLRGLEERGKLRRLPDRERAIQLLVAVPLSRAPDGAPLYAVPLRQPPASYIREY